LESWHNIQLENIGLPVSDIVFLRSIFSLFETFNGSSLGMSADAFRPNDPNTDFFLAGLAPFMSIVGAVVMISGAGKNVSYINQSELSNFSRFGTSSCRFASPCCGIGGGARFD